jgi:hypothetical protein
LTLLDSGLALAAGCDTSLAASEFDTVFCEMLDITSNPAASTLPLKRLLVNREHDSSAK